MDDSTPWSGSTRRKTSDVAKARLPATALTAGTLTSVLLAAGPVLLIHDALEQHGATMDGSKIVVPAVCSAFTVLLISLTAWHRSFAGHQSWVTPTRSRQIAALAGLVPMMALLVGVAAALFARALAPPAPVIAETILPLTPGISVTALGVLTGNLSTRRRGRLLGAVGLGVGLVMTPAREPTLAGWMFLCVCLVVTSETLRPRRPNRGTNTARCRRNGCERGRGPARRSTVEM
ncbi:hypothetical protein ACPEEZ_05335 [Frigoribacterium sp. 2-23]|uniref:hypothetical protein n=1 Tax=Frigoribacterium sp. 2-23 TaxID=3415006 RepID=UPI003C6F8328